MSDQTRDARGRFTSGVNELFRSRAPLHVGIGYPERNEGMNERLRSGRGRSGAEAEGSEADTPRGLEGLDGGVRTPIESDESTSDIMNRTLRVAAGREAPGRIAPNGVPLKD